MEKVAIKALLDLILDQCLSHDCLAPFIYQNFSIRGMAKSSR